MLLAGQKFPLAFSSTKEFLSSQLQILVIYATEGEVSGFVLGHCTSLAEEYCPDFKFNTHCTHCALFFFAIFSFAPSVLAAFLQYCAQGLCQRLGVFCKCSVHVSWLILLSFFCRTI